MIKFEKISEYGLLALVGMIIVCYRSTLKNAIASNCTDFKCCCLKIKRPALSNEQALELAEMETQANSSNNV